MSVLGCAGGLGVARWWGLGVARLWMRGSWGRCCGSAVLVSGAARAAAGRGMRGPSRGGAPGSRRTVVTIPACPHSGDPIGRHPHRWWQRKALGDGAGLPSGRMCLFAAPATTDHGRRSFCSTGPAAPTHPYRWNYRSVISGSTPVCTGPAGVCTGKAGCPPPCPQDLWTTLGWGGVVLFTGRRALRSGSSSG